MLKRSLCVLVAVLMLIGMLSACGTTGVSGSDSGKAKNVTLSMWYWNRSVEDQLIADVTKQYPNITIKAEKIGGDYLAKVTTTMAAGSGLPDIVCFNTWVGNLLPNAGKFVNLLEPPYDAGKIKDQYLEWKWNMALTSDGKTLIALPMDTGPTALFYRADIFESAGLPSEPDKVAAQIKDWDSYIEAAKKLQSSTKSKMFDNIGTIFTQSISQLDKLFFDKSDKFIGDQEHIRKAFDRAVNIQKQGLILGIDGWTPEWNAAMNNSSVASFIGAVWMKKILSDAAPDTKGKWKVAPAPGGPGNNGGSFIGIPKTSKYPQEAWIAIKWMMSPENSVRQLKSMDLFPSSPQAFKDESIYQKEEFFGGQETDRIFADSAQKIPVFYYPNKTETMRGFFTEELGLVAKQNKDPEQAWKDAVAKCKKEIEQSK